MERKKAMDYKFKPKKFTSIVIALLLMLNSFVFGVENEHWAKKNYDFFVQKNILEEGSQNFDRNISLDDFSKLYNLIINEDLLGIDEDSKELMTRADVVRLLAVNLELDELFEISPHDYNDGKDLDDSLKNEINKILSLGIIKGYTDNTLKLENKVTFGEAITILKRVREVSIINSIDMANVPLPEESKEMEDLSQATRNAVELFVYGSLLNEKLINVEYDESISEEWIKTRDEAEKIWDMVLKSSLLMSISVDKNISALENDLNMSLSGAKEDNLKWAQDIQAKFDAIKGNKKLGEFSKQLGMEAREALELLKLSHDIVSGNALEEAEFYRYAELVARTTKSAAKVGLFIGSTILTAGGTTAAAGYLTLGEAASVVVSGVDVVLDVSSTASNIYIGEDGRVTMAIQEAQDAFAPVSAIFGLSDFKGGDLGSQIYFLGASVIDYEYDGKILGINVTDDPSSREITYFRVPLEGGKFPSDLENSDILARMILQGNKDFAGSIYDEILYNLKKDTSSNLEGVFKDLLSEDIDDKIGDLDFQMDDFDAKFDKLLQRILDSDDMDIDEGFDDLLDEYLDELDLLFDDSVFDDLDDEIDDSNYDDDGEDYYDDSDDDYYDDEEDSEDNEEEPEDDEDDEEDSDDGDDEPDDSEDPDDEDDTDEEDPDNEDPIYYTLTIYYEIVGEDDGSGNIPETFVKKYKYGEEYNNPVREIEGYTANMDAVVGTMVSDVVVTVYYHKNYVPTLYITYIIEDGYAEAPADYVASYKVGESFSVESPVIEGYYSDPSIVEGVMMEEGYFVTVRYYRNDKYYKVTVRYLYEDESEALATYTIDVKVGDTYTITPPTIEGYYADTDEFTRTMGDVGNINYTIKYRLYPEGPEEISGVLSNDLIKVEEGTPSDTVISSYLPEKVKAYIKAGHEILEVDVDWYEDLENPMPTVNDVWSNYFYTGTYRFLGKLNLPSNVINPGDFRATIDVEFYPREYPDCIRKVTTDDYMYTVSYKDDNGLQGTWEVYNGDGTLYELYTYKDGVYHGVHEEYQGPDNAISKRSYYSSGKLEGSYETWYTHNGAKQFIGAYTNDLQTGLWQDYYSTGVLSSEGNYLEGNKHGEWKYFHENGKISSEGSYDNGVETGIWKQYDEDGNPI